MDEAAHREFKSRLYEQFARVGKAVSNPHRLELLELLAQAERTVEALARASNMSLASTSQHLQALRQGGLVQSKKVGLFVHYRISDDSVLGLARSMRTVAERRLAE